ncbi:MAG: PAS domain S-box protein, partial [Armatimonadota bacterium]
MRESTQRSSETENRDYFRQDPDQPGDDPNELISAVEDLAPVEDTRFDRDYQELSFAEYQERLQHTEDHLRMVVDGARDYAIFMIDPDGVVMTWNTGAERMKQWHTREIIGQHFRILYRPEDRDERRPEHNLDHALRLGIFEETYPRMKKDGTVFIADVTIHPVWDADSGSLRGFTKVVRDVTERQFLLERLVMAEENERRRISRELHDETGQHLAALSLGLRSLEAMQTGTQESSDPAEAAELLLRLREVAETLAKDLHRVAVELRPTSLDDLGLIPALYSYVERWSASSGIDVEFDTFGLTAFDNGGTRFSELVETTVYRVVQEALTNIAKYALLGESSA